MSLFRLETKMILDKETNFRVLILANPTSKFLPKLELSAASLVLRLKRSIPERGCTFRVCYMRAISIFKPVKEF